MKFIFSLIALWAFVQANAQNEEAELEKALFGLPDVTFKKYSKPGEKFLTYTLRVKQPLDHLHPEKRIF